ncbi:hypothetical protein KU306_17965 (plasmid) [Haloferax larsenii]|uniref:Uncharacterized protein n=1 Tax=Haloferax larsenii TaxID=302484 RepID=A0ABY5RJE8_HALLR|nr:hypothetical protein [Haloferax larsenii]ELZ80552.1 hypothetical protein C455_06761 [Haloferax larsenii JCM 13917]UVE52492.1 hypothetical protein KU306_17965 [Haloferax larsenii]
MSIAIGHFAFGAALTALTAALFVPRFRFHRTVVVFGGLWAMIPDFYHVSPVGGSFVRLLHDSAAADLFWGHGALDAFDATDSKEIAALFLGFFFVATVLSEIRMAAVRGRVEDGARGGGYSPVVANSLLFANSSPGLDSPPVAPDGDVETTPVGRSWLDTSVFGRSAKRAAAFTALLAGVGLQSLLFSRPQYIGLLVGLGALLELVGLTMLLDVSPFDRWVKSVFPPVVRTMGALVVTFAALAVAGGLLIPIQQLTPLALSYAALAIVIVLQTIRLWESAV